jgi:hypothetical protein
MRAAENLGRFTQGGATEVHTNEKNPRSGFFRVGGAEGIRTPGLLIANETRYQLRHSPLMRQEG